MTEYRFLRCGYWRPPAYWVETPADCIGLVEAVDPGRPGQSRSTNSYRAYPMTRRGNLAQRPLPGTHPSRRAAAAAIAAYYAESQA